MENEFDELENKSKGKGWHNDHVRHSLASRGYKVSKDKRDRNLEQIKQMSDAGELTWQEFQKVYGAEAEGKLTELFDDGKIEMELCETESPESRVRYGETRLELDEDGKTKTYSVERDTTIKLLSY